MVGLAVTVFGLIVAWEMAKWISGGQIRQMIYVFLGVLVCLFGAVIIQNWRTGFYLFLFWLVFEDLVRKYLGNNMAIYFGKDVLAILTYISLFLSVRRGSDKVFRPPFAISLAIMIWFAVIQSFNPYSPSPLYGVLGLKLDFLYAGLMFVGYALLRSDDDLTRFISVSMILAAVVSVLGIVQSILGLQFLNPATLAPELKEMGELQKFSPISHELLNLPSSVFVSASRYSSFMLVATMFGLGASGYMLLRTSARGRKLVWVCLGLIAAGVVVSGSRGALVLSLVTTAVTSAAFIWGAPWRTGRVHRMVISIGRSAVAIVVGVVLVAVFYPAALGGKVAFYSETLLPSSDAYQLSDRLWDYPLYNLGLAFSVPHWATGYGTGTSSLGVQYVARLLQEKPLGIGAESGYGTIVIEFGIVGLALWIMWTSVLVFSCWRVVMMLRQTRVFPLAFMTLWFTFILLFPQTFTSINAYQDYLVNAYLWLFIGMLFRLPEIVATGPIPVPAQNVATSARP